MGVLYMSILYTAHKVTPVVPSTFNGKITEDKIKYLQHLVTCKTLLYKEIYMQK